ncbi:MAG: hypothetical protein NT150_00755 [Bacteroidetes bacterium]|nr:hypothetical protein [Bacteroidota bacterium]
MLFSLGYEKNRWSVNAALTPTVFFMPLYNGAQRRLEVFELSLTYCLHKKKVVE